MLVMAKKLVGDRMVVKKAELEKKLLAYLRKSGRCLDVAGVVVAPLAEATGNQANWAITAVKYGRAPQADCDEELTRIAPLFLRHFNIAAEPAEPTAQPQIPTATDEAVPAA
jgi:hypothetical protein